MWVLESNFRERLRNLSEASRAVSYLVWSLGSNKVSSSVFVWFCLRLALNPWSSCMVFQACLHHHTRLILQLSVRFLPLPPFPLWLFWDKVLLCRPDWPKSLGLSSGLPYYQAQFISNCELRRQIMFNSGFFSFPFSFFLFVVVFVCLGFLLVCVFWDSVSSPGWPQTCSVATDDPELLIFPPLYLPSAEIAASATTPGYVVTGIHSVFSMSTLSAGRAASAQWVHLTSRNTSFSAPPWWWWAAVVVELYFWICWDRLSLHNLGCPQSSLSRPGWPLAHRYLPVSSKCWE